jgi:hypothetical protein
MKSFKVSFTVDEATLPTIISMITPVVDNFSVMTCDTEVATISTKSPRSGLHNGRKPYSKPVWQHRSSKIIIDYLRQSDGFDRELLTQKFVDGGLSATSVSPSLSKLCKLNVIRRVGDSFEMV